MEVSDDPDERLCKKANGQFSLLIHNSCLAIV